jgi:hypothetical protein
VRFSRSVVLIAGLVLVEASQAQAQYALPIPAARPLQFESWSAASPVEVSSDQTLGRLVVGSRNGTHQALLGGAIGAAAGLFVCTAFATVINDSAGGGLSFCPLDTNLLFGGAGFVLGAAIGWGLTR